jgi:disulfide bond formation protein DsbB
VRPRQAPRIAFLLTGLFAASLVAGGLMLARLLNLAACPLCILQRMAYLLLALEGLMAAALVVRPVAVRAAALLMGLTALAGASVAAYQTWLQRFAQGISCTADQPWWERFVDWAGTQVPLLFEATGLCSEAGWRFLGLSIAEWSLIIFTSLTLVALRLAVRALR